MEYNDVNIYIQYDILVRLQRMKSLDYSLLPFSKELLMSSVIKQERRDLFPVISRMMKMLFKLNTVN